MGCALGSVLVCSLSWVQGYRLLESARSHRPLRMTEELALESRDASSGMGCGETAQGALLSS